MGLLLLTRQPFQLDTRMAKIKKSEVVLKEMQRRANDEIRVLNPTGEDYPVKWSGYTWVVPANGKQVLPRYIAMNYIKHMTDKLITEESEKMLAKEKEKYKGDTWAYNKEVDMRRALKTNNPVLRKKYLKQLWGGVVKEYGLDQPIPEDTHKPADTRPLDEQLIAEIEGGEKAPLYVAKKDRKGKEELVEAIKE